MEDKKQLKKKNKRGDIYCGNCGKYGHTYKKCSDPVTSLGVILFKNETDENDLKYLLIQRKDTLGYVEFMRGKYKLDSIDFIKKLLFEITQNEINKLKNYDFDNLWKILWMKQTTKNYKNEYELSKNKFCELKKGYSLDGQNINLDKILSEIDTNWIEPEWGFPKGRRNLRETDINCAAREFKEETGFKDDEWRRVKKRKPVIEDFVGTNNVRYRHIYFIGKCITDKIPTINKDNKIQISEVSNIGWFDLDTAISKLRPYNIEKKKVLKKVNEIILNNKLYEKKNNINIIDEVLFKI